MASSCPEPLLIRCAVGAKRWLAPSSSCRHLGQIADPHQVVNRRREGEHPAHAQDATVAGLPHQTHGLQPPEDLFDPLALFLTLGVSGVACRPTVDGARTPRGVLRQVRRDVSFAAGGETLERGLEQLREGLLRLADSGRRG